MQKTIDWISEWQGRVNGLKTPADVIAYFKRLGHTWPTDSDHITALWTRLCSISFDFPADQVEAATPGLFHLLFGDLIGVLARHSVFRTQPVIDHLIGLIKDDRLPVHMRVGRSIENLRQLAAELPSVWSDNRAEALEMLDLRSERPRGSLVGLVQSTVFSSHDRLAIVQRAVTQVNVKDRDAVSVIGGLIRVHGGPSERTTLFDRIRAQAASDVSEQEQKQDVISDYVDGKADWTDVKLYVDDPEAYLQAQRFVGPSWAFCQRFRPTSW